MKRLSFKGEEKTKKKTKRTVVKIPEATVDQAPDDSLWIDAEEINDIVGPFVLITGVLGGQNMLNSVSGTTIVTFKAPPGQPEDAEEFAPWVATQVFVSTLNGRCVFLKNAYDRYLTSDKFGVVSCDAEACGPYCEWQVDQTNAGFVFKGEYGYLTIENDGTIRADADEAGANQSFSIKVQRKAQQEAKKQTKLLGAIAQAEKLRKVYSFGGRLEKFLEHDLDGLDHATKEGTLNQELLNRRSKMKADRYCK